jgi:hypothetical protein
MTRKSRTFAEFILSEGEGLRMTTRDSARCHFENKAFIFGPCSGLALMMLAQPTS